MEEDLGPQQVAESVAESYDQNEAAIAEAATMDLKPSHQATMEDSFLMPYPISLISNFQLIPADPTYQGLEVNMLQKEYEESCWAQPNRGLMTLVQVEINELMRAIMLDWLVEVAEEFSLQRETLSLAVNYVDRFLERETITRNKFQLLGVTCMHIASKFEEIHPPRIDDFVYITDNTYTKDEILKAEIEVLKVLNFKLCAVTANSFLQRFMIVAGAPTDSRLYNFAYYLIETTLCMYSIQRIKYKPSHLAAAVVCVAKHTFGLPAWTPIFGEYTGYTQEDLCQCVRELCDMHKFMKTIPTGRMTGTREKFMKPEYDRVSRLTIASYPF